MNLEYAVVQYDEVIGYVYSSKFGIVIVIDRKSIDLTKKLEIYNMKDNKTEKDGVDVLELLLNHLGIKEDENRFDLQ